jgi:enoyl-CoA hydratase/carnithine racemase
MIRSGIWRILGSQGSLTRRLLSSDLSKNLVVVSEIESGIFHVMFNRPDKLNALSYPMFEAIANTASSFKGNKSVRAIIISGNGRAFCSGLDVSSIGKNPLNFNNLLKKPAGTEISNLAQDVGYLWRQLPVPVIASLHGVCFGGGLQIAMGADFRISTPDCKMSVMEAKWGLIPDMSAAVTFRETVRMDVIKELTMTARIFSGQEGKEYGFVTRYFLPLCLSALILHHVFTFDITAWWCRCAQDPFAASLALAQELREKSPDAIAACKKLFQETYAGGVSEKEALDMETKLQKKLIGSWNQVSASTRTVIPNVPFVGVKDFNSE